MSLVAHSILHFDHDLKINKVSVSFALKMKNRNLKLLPTGREAGSIIVSSLDSRTTAAITYALIITSTNKNEKIIGSFISSRMNISTEREKDSILFVPFPHC